MTASSHSGTPVGRRRTVRTLIALASAGAIGTALAACSPNEEPGDAPYTTPSVVTGDQAPPGDLDVVDGIGASPEEQGVAEILDTDGNRVGTATFAPSGSSVKVTVKVTGGLDAGFHGMHLHTNGVCEDDFSSAGGHLQVDGNTDHPASGDLVSLNVLADGTGETVTTTDAVTLDDIVGKAIIIHENADNFANIPTRYAPAPDAETLATGDAGARIACGVIEAQG